MFSVPKLNIDETQSIKVNFYELIQQNEILSDSSAPNTSIKKAIKKTSAINEKTNTDEASSVFVFSLIAEVFFIAFLIEVLGAEESDKISFC